MSKIIISGAGLTGLLVAHALMSAGLDVSVIEKGSTEAILAREGRTLSISYASQKLLDQWGVWQHVDNEAEPILSVRVVDGYSHSFVHFDSDMVSDSPVGYMVPAHALYAALSSLVDRGNVIEGTTCTVAHYDSCKVMVRIGDDKLLSCPLFIAAEGKGGNSYVETRVFDYEQTMLTFLITHTKHHENVAVERFFAEGPFAILPCKGGFTSAIVWTESHSKAATLNSDGDILMEELGRRVGYLGDVELASTIKRFPISLRYAKNYCNGAILVLGDAAHSVHPLAGQGFNLTIGDVDVLARLLCDAKHYGINYPTILSQFNKKRRPYNSAMIAATDGLNALFSNHSKSLRVIRRAGMRLVNRSTVTKKLCMRVAMGLI